MEKLDTEGTRMAEIVEAEDAIRWADFQERVAEELARLDVSER